MLKKSGNWSTGSLEDQNFWKSETTQQGFLYVDSQSIFCPDSKCSNFLDGTWLYQDEDHLSLAGSRMLIPALKSALRSNY
jgi:hypothetical protein